MLVGAYVHKVTKQGLVTLPARHRAYIAGYRLYLVALHGPAIGVFDDAGWQQYLSASRNPATFAYTMESELDSVGRFRIPPRLLQHAELDNLALLLGMHNRVEVWSPDNDPRRDSPSLWSTVDDTGVPEAAMMQPTLHAPVSDAHVTPLFISYSHVDRGFVNDLAAILDDLSIPYFLDVKDIDWGRSIYDGVSNGLATCSALIVVVSPASLKSQWVPFEIGRAVGAGKQVMPLLVHPSLDLPSYLGDLRYLTDLDAVRTHFADST